jgi:hypothetical protein
VREGDESDEDRDEVEADGTEAPPSARLTPEATPDGPRLPAFARAYPRDPELDALLRAMAGGDHARVHAEAEPLAARADKDGREEVARAARDLRRRLEPDPMVLWMFAGSLALLGFLVFWFYTHRH